MPDDDCKAGGGDSSLAGLAVSGGGSTPRRQHYVSAMLLKQWGDQVEGRDTVIGRFDMYTRQTSKRTAGEECALGARDGGQAFLAAIRESEDEWQSVESAAAVKLDLIRERMGAGGGFAPDVKDILKQPKTLDLLRRLAVLHHGRNLRAVLECLKGAKAGGASAGERAERLRASIAARMADAEERYRGAMLFRTPDRGSEFVLGSVPVTEDEVYGPSGALAESMMPLTPFLLMAAARNHFDTAHEMQFNVVDEHGVRLSSCEQSARGFGSSLVYCRPSCLAEAAAPVAEFTAGGAWHWEGLEQRFRRHRRRVPHNQQTHICNILQEQQRRRAEFKKNAAPGWPAVHEEHRQWCREKARELEDILARAGVPPAEPLPPLTY